MWHCYDNINRWWDSWVDFRCYLLRPISCMRDIYPSESALLRGLLRDPNSYLCKVCRRFEENQQNSEQLGWRSAIGFKSSTFNLLALTSELLSNWWNQQFPWNVIILSTIITKIMEAELKTFISGLQSLNYIQYFTLNKKYGFYKIYHLYNS